MVEQLTNPQEPEIFIASVAWTFKGQLIMQRVEVLVSFGEGEARAILEESFTLAVNNNSGDTLPDLVTYTIENLNTVLRRAEKGDLSYAHQPTTEIHVRELIGKSRTN